MFQDSKKKQIILVRHAKALEIDEFKGVDFDRPLTEKGKKSANIVAKYLRLSGVRPSRIVASPALRTKQTAEIFAAQYGIEDIDYVPSLYYGIPSGERDANIVHLGVVRGTKKDTEILMIVGHNNDLTNFARYLSGDDVPLMKKGSLVILALPDDIDWKEVTPGSLSLLFYLTPQFLKLEELT